MRLRAAGLVLALAAITFKAFLPPGFMFGEQSGQVGVVLCTIDGATLSHDVGEPQKPTQGSAGQQCPFAVASAAAFAPTIIEASAPSEAAFVVAAATPLAERPAALLIGPPLPARGPPLQA
jgi:hypothetical protein